MAKYVLFAPERTDGPKLSGWRRDTAGQFVEWPVDEHGALWSRALGGLGIFVEGGLWLRAMEAEGRRLPTPIELAREERRRADTQAARATVEAAGRAAAEASARLDVETAARLEAEAEAIRLRAELRRLRGEDV